MFLCLSALRIRGKEKLIALSYLVLFQCYSNYPIFIYGVIRQRDLMLVIKKPNYLVYGICSSVFQNVATRTAAPTAPANPPAVSATPDGKGRSATRGFVTTDAWITGSAPTGRASAPMVSSAQLIR